MGCPNDFSPPLGFTGKSPDLVPVYLIPNPDPKNMGGGYNGGRLTIEVPTVADAIPTTLHELFHAFLETKKAEIEAAVAGVPGLDSETLNEGLAYALSPGIVHADSDGADPLVRTVRRQFAENKPLSDTFTRSNRYALSLRPLLQAALGSYCPELAAQRRSTLMRNRLSSSRICSSSGRRCNTPTSRDSGRPIAKP